MSPETRYRINKELVSFCHRYPAIDRGFYIMPVHAKYVAFYLPSGESATSYLALKLERGDEDVLELRKIVAKILLLGGKVEGWPL